jgi:hypothetical protein
MFYGSSFVKKLMIGMFFLMAFRAGGQPSCTADDAQSGQTESRYYLELNGQRFYLAYVSDKQDQYLKEYIPAGENLERWNQLMSIRVFPKFPKDAGVDGYVKNMIEAIKAGDPANRYQVFKDEGGGQILDFLLWTDKPEHFAEWNLMQIEYLDGVGLVVGQYANRFYLSGADEAKMTKFGNDLHKRREKMLSIFKNADFKEQEEQAAETSGAAK